MASCKGPIVCLQNPKHKRGCLFSNVIDTVHAREFYFWTKISVENQDQATSQVRLCISYQSQLWFKVPFGGINSLFQGFIWWGVKFFSPSSIFVSVIYIVPSEQLEQAKASTKSKLNPSLIHDKRLASGLQRLICSSPMQVLTMATSSL